ncbi:MAG TPA: benzoate/H(+) symporter BenE family transporter [Aquella sp.]|nr:benzoate/H(+) symporter BenE family transporter [Aquella sp.]
MSKFFYLPNIIAGLVSVIVGFTSSVAIIFQAAAAAGASPAEISSWLLALGVGMGVTGIGLSLYYRIPIVIAWSTPGAALLVTSLAGIPMQEIIGGFIFSAALITLFGITGIFEKVMIYIPRSLASAMLAGVLFHFGINVFLIMQNQFILGFLMFITYLVGKRIFPRYVILVVLLLGVLIVQAKGLFHLQHINISLSHPIFIMPAFSFSTIMSISVPLFIVTMTSQNIPGIAIINSAGYKPNVSSIISWTGITNLLLAPFGGYAFNLAAITAAICLGKEADHNPATRYRAAIYAGIFYLLTGLFSATVVAIFLALPKELILIVAGLALFGTIGLSLRSAVENDSQREPALITLLVSASGVSLFGIGSAFWGLLAGVLSFIIGREFLKGN